MKTELEKMQMRTRRHAEATAICLQFVTKDSTRIKLLIIQNRRGTNTDWSKTDADIHNEKRRFHAGLIQNCRGRLGDGRGCWRSVKKTNKRQIEEWQVK